MKRSDNLVIKNSHRHRQIIALINSRRKVSVYELSAHLDLSIQTIRRELRYLEQQNLIIRTKGGAMALDSISTQNNLTSNDLSLSASAVSLINEHDVVALDSSSFSIALARQIRQMDFSVTVLTASLEVATELSSASNCRLVVTGGIFRRTSQSLEGTLTLQAIKSFRIEKAFITCDGFTLQDGPTESDDYQAQFKSLLMQNANQTILAIPNEIIGKNSLIPLCSLSALSWIILVEPLDSRQMEVLQSLGIKTLVDPFAYRKKQDR
ncbi:DeoR/GlpR family DNA-binding transcription regulator [Sulfobacillus thermosulfidooxidans]|uniref:DeoR/GlpR family DNA-binding transcription regulator n=1 Tax=Sulfobacillus thermosulfidooxidans TaxID=28034 RepID=UPI00031C9635|nr:DeoR/GlpR family DNA-binding transcription regulator [Sulfobacillus thermosulfidooxidans]